MKKPTKKRINYTHVRIGAYCSTGNGNVKTTRTKNTIKTYLSSILLQKTRRDLQLGQWRGLCDGCTWWCQRWLAKRDLTPSPSCMIHSADIARPYTNDQSTTLFPAPSLRLVSFKAERKLFWGFWPFEPTIPNLHLPCLKGPWLTMMPFEIARKGIAGYCNNIIKYKKIKVKVEDYCFDTSWTYFLQSVKGSEMSVVSTIDYYTFASGIMLQTLRSTRIKVFFTER